MIKYAKIKKVQLRRAVYFQKKNLHNYYLGSFILIDSYNYI